jgi:hypothetical protein
MSNVACPWSISYAAQLLITLDLWTEWLHKDEPLDVLFLDFKKAFDSVPHNRLIQKLKEYGFAGNLRNGIQHFLPERKESIIVNGYLSEWVTVLSGIP